jgi:hypothetical protein
MYAFSHLVILIDQVDERKRALEAVLDLVNRHPDELKQMKQTIEGMLK